MKAVFSLPDGADNLIQLDLQGQAVAVLAVLNDEHHEEGGNGGDRVDHHLPAWRKSQNKAR